MSKYAVGVDDLFAIEAASERGAELKLRSKIINGEFDAEDIHCVVYEELVE